MELLILSKLKWDITAVTSYDYLEYLLDFLLEPNRNRNSNELTRLPVLIKTSTAENIRLESFKAMLKSLHCIYNSTKYIYTNVN